MLPKEKAKEMVGKMLETINRTSVDDLNGDVQMMNFHIAKQCALIAVKEANYFGRYGMFLEDWSQSINQEIESLQHL